LDRPDNTVKAGSDEDESQTFSMMEERALQRRMMVPGVRMDESNGIKRDRYEF
jgi:hypothetical protein